MNDASNNFIFYTVIIGEICFRHVNTNPNVQQNSVQFLHALFVCLEQYIKTAEGLNKNDSALYDSRLR